MSWTDRLKQAGQDTTRPSVSQLIVAVAEDWGVRAEAVRGRRRTERLSGARAVVWSILRSVYGWSYDEIGHEFDRDHSTILHAVRKVLGDQAEVSSEDWARAVARINLRLKAAGCPEIRRAS